MVDEKYYLETMKIVLLRLLEAQEFGASLAVVLKEQGLWDEVRHRDAWHRIKIQNQAARERIEKLGQEDLPDWAKDLEGPIQ